MEKKLPNRKRNIPLCIRVSEKEHQALEQKLKESNKNKTDYLVSILLNQEICVYSFDQDIKEIFYELQKIGVNLNQIARKINSGMFQGCEEDIRRITRKHTELCNQFLNFITTVKIR